MGGYAQNNLGSKRSRPPKKIPQNAPLNGLKHEKNNFPDKSADLLIKLTEPIARPPDEPPAKLLNLFLELLLNYRLKLLD
jgi:hypothetical protein